MPEIGAAEIRAVLRKAISELMNVDIPELTEDTRLYVDLALDSRSVIGLLFTLEDSMGFRFDPDALTAETFQTVGTLTTYVGACLSSAPRH